jgi:biopolymer transport protein ExbD
MAIHSAGPRLFSSIPFRFIGASRKGHSAGGAAVNVALNVTPFVDMMTILVSFLLMVFSAEGALAVQPNQKLPEATPVNKIKMAPIVVVTKDEVAFSGDPAALARVADLEKDESLEWKIPALEERLTREMQTFLLNKNKGGLSQTERDYCDKPPAKPKAYEICLQGLLILQADRSISAKVLNRVVKTAYASGYVNIMFAVNRRSGRP